MRSHYEFQNSKLYVVSCNYLLGGGFKYFLFLSLFGEDSHFDSTNILQLGWNHQLVCFVPKTWLVFSFYDTIACNTYISYPIGSMGLVYLPTVHVVDSSGNSTQIYKSHGSYGYRKILHHLGCITTGAGFLKSKVWVPSIGIFLCIYIFTSPQNKCKNKRNTRGIPCRSWTCLLTESSSLKQVNQAPKGFHWQIEENTANVFFFY